MKAFSGVGLRSEFGRLRNFSSPYAPWVGTRVTDSVICGTKVEGTPLQSVAITDAQSDAALDRASARAFDENHLPAYTERCGPAPRPIPDLVTGVPHRVENAAAAKRSPARKTPWPRYLDRRNRRPLPYLK